MHPDQIRPGVHVLAPCGRSLEPAIVQKRAGSVGWWVRYAVRQGPTSAFDAIVRADEMRAMGRIGGAA